MEVNKNLQQAYYDPVTGLSSAQKLYHRLSNLIESNSKGIIDYLYSSGFD